MSIDLLEIPEQQQLPYMPCGVYGDEESENHAEAEKPPRTNNAELRTSSEPPPFPKSVEE